MVRSWQLSTILLLVLRLSSPVHGDARSDAPTSRCISATPRQLPHNQATRLCLYASEGLADGPALCAAAVVRTLVSFSFTTVDLANNVVDLCERAADTQPADCWTAAMASSSQLHRSSRWRQAVVKVCKSATSTVPAQCLHAFKRHGLITTEDSSSKQEAALYTVAEICRTFQGDVSAIGTCLARVPRSLTENSRYTLCRHGNASSVGDVVDCAKQLLQRITKSDIIVQVCAFAASPSDQPQACVLAAQQQLRWMDTGTVVHLCQHSRATAAPVQCATTLRSWFIAQFTRNHSVRDLARLCHGAVDAEAIVGCVKKLPTQLFQSDQVVRLCGHRETGHASAKADCVVTARQQLFGAGYQYRTGDGDSLRYEHTTLLLSLCDGANGSSASLDCLVATVTQSPAFSAQQRVRLCQHATSVAPHQCFRSIHASLLARLPGQAADGIELCRQATSASPATCVNLLHRQSASFFQLGLPLALCANASSAAPALCFAAAPHDFSDHDKTVLCLQAESQAPASCAKVFLPRIQQTSMMAQLCAQAESTAPARCASASPFGMDAHDLLTLCRHATDEKPAQCARAVAPHLKVPWQDAAAACQHANATTPGSCLAHRVRQRVPLNHRVITECRAMAATASTIEIVQFAYECAELVPKCPAILNARVLDQFGDDMASLSHGYMHLTAVPDAEDDLKTTVVEGVTVVPIRNGSVVFRELQFAVAGNFTLRLTAAGVAEDMVARLHVRTNETERRQHDHCARVFSFMQCGPPQTSMKDILTSGSSTRLHNGMALQILQLPNRWVLVALECESLWVDQHPGLQPAGTIQNAKLYTLPRIAYQLLTDLNLPTLAMSAWECLGVPEGSNRSTIRRGYHKRSLEWHPDKWAITGDVASTALLRSKVEAVYARINAAYQQLLKLTPLN